MASWTFFLFAYLLGGITFIPLVIIAVLAHGFYTLPERPDLDPNFVQDASNIVQPGDDTTSLEAAAKKDDSKSQANRELDVAAGFFAVCREYTPMGINAKPIERSTPVGSATVASPSPSVYQTMYRSLFERKAAGGPMDNKNGGSQRPKNAGNVFYVVLRHGHLMLFDDEEQVEVRHVISLAHHDVSIYSGGDNTPEGELFIKRNAICLSRKKDSPELAPDSQISKPFYLFSENCSTKEDFYFALLKNQEQTFTDAQAPTPKSFDVKSIISLVEKLHSSEGNVHSRWLNAMIGRVFLGIHKTSDLETLIREKLTKKISRVKTPSFLTNIAIQKIDTGDSPPYFTNLKLRDLSVEGECVMEADVKYSGHFRIEVAATVKIDLGQRFKTREVNLVLAVVLKRAEGHMLVKIKPLPSNRVWFAFQAMPKMEMAIEPIVSLRQITYTVILRQIENRIKEVVAETFVLPFWDDLPFFKTEHKIWRGGIFEGDDATVPSEDVETNLAQTGHVNAVNKLEESPEIEAETRPLAKSMTLPAIEKEKQPSPGLFARRFSKEVNTSPTASTTSIDSKGMSASAPPRSPTLTKKTTEPVVGTAAAHADVFKPSSPPEHATDYMAALHSRSKEASPSTAPTGSTEKAPSLKKRASHSSLSSKDGELSSSPEDSRATPRVGRRSTTSSAGSGSHSDDKLSTSSTKSSLKESLKSQTGTIGRNFFMRREGSEISLSGQSTNSDSSQKRNTLSAVTNAAVQARQWGWNAIQKQRDAKRNGEHGSQPVDLSQPMGRGQPLPPPGTPLPGPTNGTTRIVPPPNLGRRLSQPPASEHASDSHETHHERKVPPPPLPARRRRGPSQNHDSGSESNTILIVAAPEDSQPSTPSGDKPSKDAGGWMDHPESSKKPAPPLPPRKSSDRGSRVPSDGEAVNTETLARGLPASSIVDNDDISGWLEENAAEEKGKKDKKEKKDGDSNYISPEVQSHLLT